MKQDFFQLFIMPWANLKREIKIGSVTFYPFSSLTTELIPEGEVRDYLKLYFKCFVDHDDKPVGSITLATIGKLDFRIMSNKEANDISNALNVLIFSIIAPQTNSAVISNNNSIGPPSTDKYIQYIQNFNPKEHHIAVQREGSLDAGFTIEKIKFHLPFGLGGVFDQPDEEIAGAFNPIFDSSFPSQESERLFRALDWFQFAHPKSESIKPISKIVMMATAFEILLDLPETNDKKKMFAEKVESLCKFPDSITETRDGRTYTKIAWWVWDFYNLRNSIVHGDKIKTLRYETGQAPWLSHLIVADLVFHELVHRDLFSKKLLGKDVVDFYKKLLPEISEDEINSHSFAITFGYKQTHQALGWLDI